MTILRSIAEIRVSTGALTRLAPGALLLLAVTGTNTAVGDGTWNLSVSTMPPAETTLTDTIAQAVGLSHGSGVHTTIVCGGLVHDARSILVFMPVTESRLGWAKWLDADVARGEELRFITGGIDPPLPIGNHG